MRIMQELTFPALVYQCEVCELEGFNKASMEEHIEKTHTCLECKTLHKDIYELNRHKEREHTPKTNQCNDCEFSAESEWKLRDHMRTHMQAVYNCEVCGKKGNSQNEIDEHIQSVHVREMFQHFCIRATFTELRPFCGITKQFRTLCIPKCLEIATVQTLWT